MITVALAKGSLLKHSVRRFADAGLDFSPLLDPDNRQLVVPSACGTAQALLVRNADVPVYVAYGQAQLGLWATTCCGSTSCRWRPWWTWASGAAAWRWPSRPAAATGGPASCLPTAGWPASSPAAPPTFFDQLDLPVELIHLTGSVELGPLTGISEAIVDLVATGRTLKDNGLVAIEDLFASTARLDRPSPRAPP